MIVSSDLSTDLLGKRVTVKSTTNWCSWEDGIFGVVRGVYLVEHTVTLLVEVGHPIAKPPGHQCSEQPGCLIILPPWLEGGESVAVPAHTLIPISTSPGAYSHAIAVVVTDEAVKS